MSQNEPLKPLSDCSSDVTPGHETIIIPRRDDPQFNPAILLKRQEGCLIKDLIDRHAPGNFRQYCDRIGMSPPNFHLILNGDRKCSLETLNRILSGIRYEVRVSTTITVQAMPTGPVVNDVFSQQDEDSWHSEETVPTPTESPLVDPPESSSSDQAPTTQTHQQGFLLLDLPDEFLTL